MRSGESDEVLVMEALRGSKRAFDLLHEKYLQPLRRAAEGHFRCPSQVDVVVNQTFARAFTRLHLWDVEVGCFQNWLFTILRNFAIDAHRRREGELRQVGRYARTRKLYDPGDIESNDPCELHSERWFLAPVREEVDRVLAKLGPERRHWLIRMPDRRQMDVEKAAMSRARREIAAPLDIHRSGPALREAVARELLLTKLCGKHAGGAHL